MLLASGANFASSPKRMNIHALDPVFIASLVASESVRNYCDIEDIILHPREFYARADNQYNINAKKEKDNLAKKAEKVIPILKKGMDEVTGFFSAVTDKFQKAALIEEEDTESTVEKDE
jgi:hypothetical protein